MSTSGSFTPASLPECPYAVTQTWASAEALRAAGSLLENCVVTIPGPVIGNAVTGTSPTFITLQPTGPSAFADEALVATTFDDNPWQGSYEFSTQRLWRLTDNLGNTAQDVDVSPDTVTTVFPWGVTTWRDNYAEDWTAITPVVGAINPVTNNRFIGGSSLDLTGWTPALFNVINGCEFTQTGTIHIQGGSVWNRTTANLGSINCAGGARITLTDATLVSSSLVNNATVDARAISVVRSLVDSSTLTQGSDVGGTLAISDSTLINSAVTIDPGAFKAFTMSADSRLGLAQIQLSGGATLRSFGMTSSRFFGGAAGNEVNLIGDSPVSLTRCDISTTFTWNLDGTGSAGLIMIDTTLQAVNIQRGPNSTRMDVNRSVLSSCLFTNNGSGNLTIQQTQGASAVIDQQTGSTGSLSLDGTLFRGGGTVTMLPACDRAASILSCEFTNGGAITMSGTGGVVSPGDRYDHNELIGSASIVNSAAGNASATIVVRNRIRGTSLGNASINIIGTSTAVFVDDNDVEGTITLNNVPAGALGAGTAFHDNKVNAGCVLSYDGGDAAAKQIRNNVVEGLSTMTITALTGSAGAGLADLFACRVSGQSVMTMTGARVVGQPTRNTDVSNGSVLNVQANGTVLQCAVRAGATLNTGAFRHSESIIDGAITVTATAANINKLANKSFSDWI